MSAYVAGTRGGERMGIFYFDPYGAGRKKSVGVDVGVYRAQEAFKDAITPIVSNNSNYVKGEQAKTGADLVGRRRHPIP
jgi:peptidyl-dipeptidase Dcp